MKKYILLFSILLIASTVIIPQKANKMNDIKPVLLPIKNDPTISFKIWFRTGSQNDPAGKEGLSYITARLISDGATKNNSYEQILEKLFPLAASYNLNSSMEMTVFSGRVHKDNLKDYYPLFIDAILNPAFKQEDFKRIKDETLNYLQTTLKYSSDEELGKAVLYNSIFAGTPYGHIEEGTISGVSSITIEDVQDFYHKNYTRNNFTVGLGGSYDDVLLKQLQNDLNKLPDVKPVSAPEIKSAPISGLEVNIVEKDANATAFSIGYPIDVVRGSKEWYALAIANSWLGEHRNSSSHLYQVIREARGLNYGDYSYIEHFPNGGSLQMPPVNVPRRRQIFEVWIRPVPNETRHFVLRTAIRELQDLIDNGMTQQEFDLTRKFLRNYVLHFAPNTSMRLGYALDDKFYGIEGSHLEKYRTMMDQITLQDVNNAIKKHLQYNNMKIAVITNNAADFKNAIVNNTASPIQYATPKADHVYKEDQFIQNYKLNISADKVKILHLDELFK